MKTINMKTQIGPDGTLHLDVPCQLPPGPAEVVVIVQPLPRMQQPPYETFEGILKGVLPADLDIDAELHDMNRQWKTNIEPTQ